MGPMNVVKRQSLSDEAISRFIDPRTGEPLRPLGVVGGRVVWPIMGASPDDPNDDDEKDDKKETEDDKDDPEGSGSDEGAGGSDKGDPQAKIAALEEEKNRHVRRRKETETELQAARDKLAELEGKDKTETERLQARTNELEAENKSLQEGLREARLQNAFLSDNSYSWHNPGRALALADLSEVEIDEDGTVHGLKAALDKLAKSDAYLIKPKGEGDDSEDPPNTSVTNKSKKQQKNSDADRKALEDKYPALRR